MENRNYELIRYLLNAVSDARKEPEDHKDFNILKNNFHLFSKRNKYVMNVFRHYNKLLEFNSDLNKVELFLRIFPSATLFKENDLDHFAYIKYHTEVFFHKIHTILEIKKLMINEVYNLGLSEKNCSWDNILKKKSKVNAPMAIAENYYKSFKHIIDARHFNAHRGYYNVESEIDISAPLNIYKWSEEFEMDLGEDFKKIIPKFYIEYQLKKFRKQRIKFVKDGIVAATYYKNEFEKYILEDFRKILEDWEQD